MLNSMVMLIFSILDQKYNFGQIWFKISKLSVWNKTWWLEKLKNVEPDGDVCQPYFGSKIHFLYKFDLKSYNCLFKKKPNT